MNRLLFFAIAVACASQVVLTGDSQAKAVSSQVEEHDGYSARALLARSIQPDVFRHIVYKSTGRRLRRPEPQGLRQLSIPHVPFIRESDPLEDFVPTGSYAPEHAPVKHTALNETILDRIAVYDPLIRTYSNMNGLETNLVKAVIYVESAGDRNAVSHKGAEGLMQLMPGTAADIGVSNSFDPAQNIYGGTRYLGSLLRRFKRIDLALWGYNAGPESVTRKRLPLVTKRYIPNILRIKSLLDKAGV